MEALEKDTIVYEAIDIDDDDEASMDEDESKLQHVCFSFPFYCGLNFMHHLILAMYQVILLNR